MQKKAAPETTPRGPAVDVNRAIDAELRRLDPQLAHFLWTRFRVGARFGYSATAAQHAHDTARIESSALRALRANALRTPEDDNSRLSGRTNVLKRHDLY